MTFDTTKEYGNAIPGEGYPSGREYIDAIMADAKKVLPPDTQYWFISWTEAGKRKAGWVYLPAGLQVAREKVKLFNPLNPGVPLRT